MRGSGKRDQEATGRTVTGRHNGQLIIAAWQHPCDTGNRMVTFRNKRRYRNRGSTGLTDCLRSQENARLDYTQSGEIRRGVERRQRDRLRVAS